MTEIQLKRTKIASHQSMMQQLFISEILFSISQIGNKNWILAPGQICQLANLWLPAGARLNLLNSAVIDIMIKMIRAIKSNCKSLLIAEENFVIKEQSEYPLLSLNKGQPFMC